ncbi:hypothetical protein [Streptomyces justiciae]|uniref:hypothetical protein n=1 Tax=Streptomyces justiciae TaxID=2780140 RepID=UPI001881B281|nr:hypothetical protein [Streptomyces justiciae]MBE8478379.1 hypothetical protein [Streptomyces justiciae]
MPATVAGRLTHGVGIGLGEGETKAHREEAVGALLGYGQRPTGHRDEGDRPQDLESFVLGVGHRSAPGVRDGGGRRVPGTGGALIVTVPAGAGARLLGPV